MIMYFLYITIYCYHQATTLVAFSYLRKMKTREKVAIDIHVTDQSLSRRASEFSDRGCTLFPYENLRHLSLKMLTLSSA